MDNPVYSQERISTIKQSDLTCLFFFILSGSLSSCTTHNSPTYSPIPTAPLLDTFTGEQGDIIYQYGLPDRAFKGPLNTTRWIYCIDSKETMIIDFDTTGNILSHYIDNDTSLCQETGPQQRIENHLPHNDPIFQNIVFAPQYRPRHLIRSPLPISSSLLIIVNANWLIYERFSNRPSGSFKSRKQLWFLSTMRCLAMK